MSSFNSYSEYKRNCISDNIEPMSEKMWKKRHRPKNRKPKEDLSRWKYSQSAPTIWEKKEKDIVFSNILDERARDGFEGSSMSNRIEARKRELKKI